MGTEKQQPGVPQSKGKRGSNKEKGKRRRRDVGNAVRDQRMDAETVALMQKDSRGRDGAVKNTVPKLAIGAIKHKHNCHSH